MRRRELVMGRRNAASRSRVDIPVVALDRGIAFYRAMLDGPVQKEESEGIPCGLLSHFDSRVGDSRVGGCLFVSNDGLRPSRSGPAIYLNAGYLNAGYLNAGYLNAGTRLGAAVGAVETHGGQVFEDVRELGPHGSRALVPGPAGHRVALHAPPA